MDGMTQTREPAGKQDFPLEQPENHGTVREICQRAGVTLRENTRGEAVALCCNRPMMVKSGMIGPDYLGCQQCGLTIGNMASPHINGGRVLTEEAYAKHGQGMWTVLREPKPREDGPQEPRRQEPKQR